MRFIAPFVSVLLTPLLVVSGFSAQMPGGSASAYRDATQDLQIHLIATDGSGMATGSLAPKRFLLEVTNANAAVVPEAAVLFRLPDSGVMGAFADGTHAAVVYTDQDGRAQMPAIRWSAPSGIASIRVSATKGTAHAGLLIQQALGTESGSASASPAAQPVAMPLELSSSLPIAAIETLPAPPAALPAIETAQSPVALAHQPGSVTRALAPAQAPNPEPKISITGASPQSEGHSGRTKWIIIAAIAVGAGVGVAMAMKGKSSSSTPAAASGLSIGAPSGGGSVGQPPH